MTEEAQLQKNSFYQGEGWQQVRKSIIKQYIQPEKLNLASDQQMIAQQAQLIEQIKQKIQRSRFKDAFGSMQVLPIDSSLSNISSAYNYGDEESLIKSKFTEQFQSSLINSALKDVKLGCSEQTYETVRNYVLNNKQKQCENLLKNLEKKNKEQEELQLTIILKQNEICRLKDQLAPYIEKYDSLQEQKRKWKKKNDQIMQKQKRIHKAQMALIFKQKMHQQVKKRNERLKEFTDSLHSKMKQIQKDLNILWANIIKQMEVGESQRCCNEPDPKGCWKKEVMKKCRQKLLQERNLLKEEQKQLEKQYEVMERVSEQCKKLVSESQDNFNPSNSQITNGGNSAIVVTSKEQKPIKLASMSLIQHQTKRT